MPWSEPAEPFLTCTIPTRRRYRASLIRVRKGGSAFYTDAPLGRHYIGLTYQYSMFLASPNQIQNETQTHSILLFYTLYLQPTLSISFFGGPQHSDTEQRGFLPSRNWSPSTGVSAGWQGAHSSLAVTYSRTITDGGGLPGAVHSNTASVSAAPAIHPQLERGLGANYSINKVLDPLISPNSGGHTISGNVTLQYALGQHFNVGIGYIRLHQSYGNIPAISTYSRSKSGFSVSLLSVSETARKVSMVEDFEDKPAESLNLEQYWSLARRRYWYFLGPLFLGWLWSGERAGSYPRFTNRRR